MLREITTERAKEILKSYGVNNPSLNEILQIKKNYTITRISKWEGKITFKGMGSWREERDNLFRLKKIESQQKIRDALPLARTFDKEIFDRKRHGEVVIKRKECIRQLEKEELTGSEIAQVMNIVAEELGYGPKRFNANSINYIICKTGQWQKE